MSMPSDADKPGEGESGESMFAGSFDLYNSGRRRRGGLRRVSAATPAVTAPAEPRSFTTSPTPEAPSDVVAEPPPPLSEPLAEAMQRADGAPDHDTPFLASTTLYTTGRTRRKSGGANMGLAFGAAIAILAVAATGAWFLMTPSQTAHNDEAQVAMATPVPVPPVMPAPMPEPMPAPVATAPLAEPAPPAPIAQSARRAEVSRTSASAARARNAASTARREARQAAAAADAAAQNAADTAPVIPTYTSPAVSAPVIAATPVIAAPPAATTPTPGADPSGAVNPPPAM